MSLLYRYPFRKLLAFVWTVCVIARRFPVTVVLLTRSVVRKHATVLLLFETVVRPLFCDACKIVVR